MGPPFIAVLPPIINTTSSGPDLPGKVICFTNVKVSLKTLLKQTGGNLKMPYLILGLGMVVVWTSPVQILTSQAS